MDAFTNTGGGSDNTIPLESSKENIIEIEIPFTLFEYLSSDECNLQHICRICLSVNNEVLYPLFSAQENNVLANMVMSIAEVQISAEDGLPANVCPLCQTEIMNYYEFKMKCVKSDYTLKSVLKGEFITKVNPPELSDDLTIKHEQKDDTIIENHDLENKVSSDIIREIDHTEREFLEKFKDTLCDDEALCIVQDAKNNEKHITIIDNGPTPVLEEIDVQVKTKKRSKRTKHYCTYCPKRFRKLKSLRAHIEKLHPEVAANCPYPCGQCNESFNSEFDLNIHGMLHTQQSNWKCTECEKHFRVKSDLRRHIQRHMRWKRFSCVHCPKSFVELYALRRHARVHTGERPEKKHACQLCDKRFMSAAQLVSHSARHSGARGVLCGECGAAFTSERLLASHARVHSDHKPHECPHCGRRFRHESTRNTHVRTHTGERPFACAQCGKTFIQRSNLTLHMRTHTGERPYSCPFCERKFSSGSTLNAHKRTHTGERPYSCGICGKSFKRVSMKLHMRVHSGSRPHACPACPKRFAARPRLREHFRLHTGEKPFECALCTARFTTKSQLIKHVKRHDKKKKTKKERKEKKGVAMMPVTVTDNNIYVETAPKPNIEPNQYVILDVNSAPEMIVPDINHANLCTVHEIPAQTAQERVYQDNDDMKTQVIVLDNNPDFGNVSYTDDVDYSNDMNLVTVNEGEVSISAASAEGTTVKLYQYDQSLLQIHTGGGHLTISRISSKMTANF